MVAKPSPPDMAMHNVRETNPDTAIRIGVVLRTAGKPTELRRRLTERLLEHLPDLPVLSHVIAGSGRSRRWSPVRPDIDAHIVEHQLSPGTRLEDALQGVLRLPFIDHAPPWDVHILSGYQDDEYSLFVRVHHAMADAGGLFNLLERLFHPQELADEDYSGVAGWRVQARASARDFAVAGRLLARNAAKTDFWRKAGATPSTQRCFRWTTVPTHSLKAIGRAHNATANDVYVAAFAKAFWSWAATHVPGLADEDLGLIIPVNVRRVAQLSNPGNYTAAVRIMLPAGISGMRELITTVSRATVPVKSPRVRHALAALNGHTPMPLYSALWQVLLTPTRATPATSNAMVRNPLQFDGDPVLSIAPLMPLPQNFPCTTALVTYEDVATLCVTTDPALPGMDTLHERWQQAVAEMAAEVSGNLDVIGKQP